MFLEKVKEIKKAEEAAAEQKEKINDTIKQIIVKAHEEGKKIIADAENAANDEVKKMISEAERKASDIFEQIKSDAKIDAVTQKVAAELHLPEAVKFLIQAAFSEFVE